MGTTLKAKQNIAEALETGSIDIPSHVAFGSGSASFDETDTTMDAELVRNAIITTTRESQTIEWTATLTTAQGNGSTIYEVGLFDAASSGDMSMREVIYPINKTSSFEYDTIIVARIK